MNSRSIALEGWGLGALAVATQGFLGESPLVVVYEAALTLDSIPDATLALSVVDVFDASMAIAETLDATLAMVGPDANLVFDQPSYSATLVALLGHDANLN